MKLLLDENLPPKLARLLGGLFPGTLHARDCGLLGKSASEVWVHARKHQFAIVSKDSDFYQRSILHGHPPKLIWLRLGNCTTQQVLNLILAHKQDIIAHGADPVEAVLVLF